MKISLAIGDKVKVYSAGVKSEGIITDIRIEWPNVVFAVYGAQWYDRDELVLIERASQESFETAMMFHYHERAE